MIRRFFIYLLIWTLSLQVLYGEIVSYRDNHLEINAMSARGFAMGGAVTAINNSVDNILYNASSLTDTNKYQFLIKSDQYLADVTQLSLLSVLPLDDKNTLGLAYIKATVGDIAIGFDTGSSIEVASRASYYEQGVILAFSHKNDERLSLGFSYKNYYNHLDTNTELYANNRADGNEFDLSSTYVLDPTLVLSGGFKNVGSAIYDKGSLKWENGYRESYDFGPYFGLGKKLAEDHLLIAADLHFSKIFNNYLNLGLEYKLYQTTSLRAGYNRTRGLSLGLGFNYEGVFIDYAYVPDYATAVDNKHFISFGYSFDSNFKVLEQYFKPKIEAEKIEPAPQKNNKKSKFKKIAELDTACVEIWEEV